MSYLIGPRLHFAGNFRADVSTVNNDATHFKDPQTPPGQGWDPGGSGGWTISNCTVKGAVFADGTVAHTSTDDPVIGMALAQNGSARLVDLDPEQQLVSQIWGMQLQLGAANPAFKGAFKTAAFSDLWGGRASTGGDGDLTMTAFYHSVLTGVIWGDVSGSRLLNELKQASASGLLSIKFNVDGFNVGTHIGRVVGTIGAALAGEPAHFIVGRQCMPVSDNSPLWFFPAVVDAQRGKLIADFGNALPATTVGGPIDSSLKLQVGLLKDGQNFSSFGPIPIGPAGWYEQTAGICEFPADRSLTSAELSDLGSTPIGVVQQTNGSTAVVAAEGSDGLHVRADDFVYRISSRETANVALRASRFGKPAANITIDLSLDPSGLQQGGGDPDVATPASGLSFQASVTTDANGLASAPLAAGSIQLPRSYIDGQVYGVRYAADGADPANGSYSNPSDFVSVLVWTDYAIPNEPTWGDNVASVLGQYANLYPVMKNIVALDNYDSVVAAKAGLQRVFSLPEEDPRYMPVTRDLSPAKRQLILTWLSTTGNGGKPNLGPAVVATLAPQLAPTAAAAAVQDDVRTLGGKTVALRRRLGRRPQQS